jgi:hypothetical protein
MPDGRRSRRFFSLALVALIAAGTVGCDSATAPGPATKEEVKTAPPPPGRAPKAQGKMKMPHL